MENIFVMGLDPFNLELLEAIDDGRRCRFHALFDTREVVQLPRQGYPSVDGLVEQACTLFAECPDGVDAVMGYWDFPTGIVVALIRARLGMPGPTLEAVGRCEHKYWSRLEQRAAVPEQVPAFQAIDPYAPEPLAELELDYPFWIKPIKAHSSFLGFHIDGPEELTKRLAQIRAQIEVVARPFNEFLAHLELPETIQPIDGYHCIAEEIVSAGFQCTLEGYSWQGAVQILGIVDSIRSGKHGSCFTRYQYPSKLPGTVRARMAEIARKLIEHIRYDGATFNIELFWDPTTDRISLLEINPRISKSHSPLFLMVDGASNHEPMLELALGRRPAFPHRAGRHPVAAKFMLRSFQDGVLERVPSEEDIVRVKELYPEARLRMRAAQGSRLSELAFQDSYSYEVAELFLGADSQKGLLDKYRRACELLDFRIRPLGAQPA